jgi:hypothetical protein
VHEELCISAGHEVLSITTRTPFPSPRRPVRQPSAPGSLGPARIQHGLEVESDGLGGDDLLGRARSSRRLPAGHGPRGHGGLDLRDAADVGVGMDAAPFDAPTDGVGGRRQVGHAPFAPRGAGPARGVGGFCAFGPGGRVRLRDGLGHEGAGGGGLSLVRLRPGG